MTEDRPNPPNTDEIAALRRQLAERQTEFDDLSMEMALAISELFHVVSKLIEGDFSVRAPEHSPIELFAKFGETVNTAINQLEANTEQLTLANVRLRREVVERKRAEERARLLSSVVEQSAVGIAVADLDGKLSFVNNAYAAMHGYEPEALVGQNLELVHPPEEAPIATQVISQLIAEGEYEEEHLHLRADGTSFPAQVHNSLLRDADGEPAGMIIDARDVTQRHRLEHELIRAEKLESLGILAGGIAHDFNNFLLAIIGSIAVVKRKLEPASDDYQRLEEAEKSCLAARRLTLQLLTFSRGGEPVKQTAEVGKLAQETTEFTLSGSKVKCVFVTAEQLWPAHVDVGQIGQVINNLVLNASQAMPDGGTLTVSATNVPAGAPEASPKVDGDQLLLTIADQGPGIPADVVPKIFDPFFTTKHDGSGLGLATAYSIVTKHQGQLAVESEPGAGATFKLYLPARPDAEIPPEPRDSRPGKASFKVLLMDDDASVRKAVSALLDSAGCDTTPTRDGSAAIEAYRRALDEGERFDVVILDLTVPAGMGGEEAIQRLIEIDPDVRAVVSSGYSTSPVMSSFADYGFKGVAAKPYRLASLLQALRQAVEAD